MSFEYWGGVYKDFRGPPFQAAARMLSGEACLTTQLMKELRIIKLKPE
jgi:hypothetical protein